MYSPQQTIGLTDMPSDVVFQIMGYFDLSDGRTFRSWKSSCKRFKQAYANSGKIKNRREKQCINFALQGIRAAQKCTHSFVENHRTEVLSVSQWQRLVDSCYETLCRDESRVKLRLRGDTSFVLAEIVQAAVILHLERANLLVTTFTPPNEYPILTAKTLEIQDLTMNPSGIGSHLNPCYRPSRNVDPQAQMWDEDAWEKMLNQRREARMSQCEMITQSAELGPEHVDKLVRRLAYKAGVVKMDNDVYDYVWRYFLFLIGKLLESTAVLFEHMASVVGGRNRKLQLGESMYNVAPHPVFLDMPNHNKRVLATPVPGMLVQIAKDLLIPHKVYGGTHDRTSHCFWHLRTGEEAETSIQEAEDEYDYVSEDTSIGYNTDGELDEDESDGNDDSDSDSGDSYSTGSESSVASESIYFDSSDGSDSDSGSDEDLALKMLHDVFNGNSDSNTTTRSEDLELKDAPVHDVYIPDDCSVFSVGL